MGTKKFLSANGKLLKDTEAVAFAKRWSETTTGCDISLDTIIIVCKRLLMNSGIGADRVLADNLSKFMTNPIPRSDIAKQTVDLNSIFKRLEMALGKFYEARQSMDSQNDGAIAEAVRKRAETSARIKSLEIKNESITALLGHLEAAPPMGLKDLLDFYKKSVFDEFPFPELEKRIKDIYGLELRLEKETKNLNDKGALIIPGRNVELVVSLRCT